jgi:phosphatidylserine/phosphatidylglycerophosphate/cardiolipin synthase-like enzyme
VYGPARRLLLPLLLPALLVASCGPSRTFPITIPPLVQASMPPAQPIPTGSDELVPLTSGPAAFTAIIRALHEARRSIDVELYEFQRLDLASLLLDARDRGVTVTAIDDPSERSSRTIWGQLQQGGIRVVAFPIERLTIDHVKLLIVDDAQAIVGGINWGTESLRNQDFDVLAEGPVVNNLERIFRQDLALAGSMTVIPPGLPDRTIQVLVTRPGDGIRAAALAAIAAARHSIDIEMFVLSDQLILDALATAARRGVHLRILLDPTQPQNATSLALLRAVGAEVRFYLQSGDELLHAKAGVFDSATVLFGSCNWSRSGFTRNHELDLLISSGQLAQVFLARMHLDWEESTPA